MGFVGLQVSVDIVGVWVSGECEYIRAWCSYLSQ